jgi:hypothetical protein
MAAPVAFRYLMAMSLQLSMIFLQLYVLILNENRATDSPWFSSPCIMAQQVPQER